MGCRLPLWFLGYSQEAGQLMISTWADILDRCNPVDGLPRYVSKLKVSAQVGDETVSVELKGQVRARVLVEEPEGLELIASNSDGPVLTLMRQPTVEMEIREAVSFDRYMVAGRGTDGFVLIAPSGRTVRYWSESDGPVRLGELAAIAEECASSDEY